ncbi:cytochrome P450 2D10-like protein [Cricetulus griseus]|nr:cytochrome P450 2D10-like protein [Cricetulus griseus]
MGLLTGDGLWSVAVLTVIFILLVDLMYRRQRWTARYPPGPMPLPLLGNLLQVDLKNMPYSLYKLQCRFGDVFSLQMAYKPVIVVNGLKAVREVLVNCGEDTADRPRMPIYEFLGFGPKSRGKGLQQGTGVGKSGVVLAPYGPEWREQRRFSVSTLRNLGLGKKSLEQWVTDEAGHLCDAFADQAGRPFNPSTMLDKAMCNVIASLIFARRFEYEDPYLTEILKIAEELLEELSGFIPEVLNMFPVLLHIPGLADKVFPHQKVFSAMLKKLLAEHKMTWDPAQPPRDLTDAFLDEVEKAKGNPESSFNDGNLLMVYEYFTCMYVCAPRVGLVLQKRALNPLDQTVVSYLVGARNGTQALCKSNKFSQPPSQLYNPFTLAFKIASLLDKPGILHSN